MNAPQKRHQFEDVKVENLLKRFPTVAPEVVIRELENTRGHAGEAAKRLKEEVSNASVSGDTSSGILTPTSERQTSGDLMEPQMQKSLLELRESLLKFRTDLEEHFNARRRRNLSSRKLHEFHLQARKRQSSAYNAAREKLGEAHPKQLKAASEQRAVEPPAEEVTRPPSEQWSTDWVFHCCKSGEEKVFKDKAILLDAKKASFLRTAVELLNAGSLECNDDLCIVYSAMHGAYFALYRHRKRQTALQRLGIIDRVRGKFSVRIIAGHNLRNQDVGVFGNSSDPFVVARIGSQEKNTKTINNNLNPVWNSEWFRFHVDSWEPSKQALHLHIFDRSNFSHDKSLGSCKVDLRKLELACAEPLRKKEVLENGNGGEIEFDMVFEPEMESEEPLREVEKLKKHIGDGVYICILGGTSFAVEETKELVIAVAEALCNSLGKRAKFITGGMHGVQEMFAKNCGDGNKVYNLLPRGNASGYGAGSDIHCQGALEWRKTIFALIGDIYITAEGGPCVVQEATAAFSRGACLVPLMRTGGASSGMFGFPAKALERPPFASEELWEILKSKTSSFAEAASAVVRIVEGFLAVQEGSVVLSPRIGKSGGAIAVGEPNAPAARTVGITGVGRLEAESPDAKGSAARREISIELVGGEEASRRLIASYLRRGAPAEEQIPDILDDQIQDLWVSELNTDSAILSAQYNRRPHGARSAPRTDCRQFMLEKQGSSWRVEKMLQPQAGRALEKDFGSIMVDGPVAAKGIEPLVAKAAEEQRPRTSPKRKAPPPLEDLSLTEDAAVSTGAAAAPGDAEDATSTLVEAVRHGLEIVEAAKTPRALFNGLATASLGSSDPMVSRENFSRFVSMYGGRSPAAHGGEKLSEELFEQLAVVSDAGEKGVPYDIFCAELCPERTPDAVLRVAGKRAALLKDLREGAARESSASALGIVVGSELLEEAGFRSVVKKLLAGPPQTVADPVAVKALWCDLVRSGKPLRRRLEPSALLKVLSSTPARSPPARPPLSDEALTSDDKAIEAAAAQAAAADLAALEADEEAAIEKLLQAMKFGIAIESTRTPRDLFDTVSTSPANSGAGSALTISEADFLPFAARLSGGNSLDTQNKRLCPEAAAAALFRELACPGSDGALGIHYELFVAEVCPESVPEVNSRLVKQRKALLRDLRQAVSSAAGRSALSRFGSQAMDEAQFVKSLTEVLSVTPDTLSAKLLWCSLVRGKHLSARVLSPKDFSSTLTSDPELSISRLAHSGSLEFSDDDASSLEMSESGQDVPIGTFSPFATPSGGVKVRLKDSIMEKSLGKENEMWDAVSTKLAEELQGAQESPKKSEAVKQIPGGLVGTSYNSAAIRKRNEERTKMQEEKGKAADREVVPTLNLTMPGGLSSAEMTTSRSEGSAALSTSRSPSDTPRRKSLSKRTERAEVCSAFNAEEVFGAEETTQAVEDEFEAVMARMSRRRTRSLGHVDEKKEDNEESRHPFRSPVAEVGSPRQRKSAVLSPKDGRGVQDRQVSFKLDNQEGQQHGDAEPNGVTTPAPTLDAAPKSVSEVIHASSPTPEAVRDPGPTAEAVSAPAPTPEVKTWAEEQALELCNQGEESLFAGKATMLDSLAAPSVPEAVAALNAGKLDGSEDCYVIYAAKKQAYFLIYKRGKRKGALQRFELADSLQGKLTVSVLGARGLSSASLDTFVVVRLSLEEQKTQVARQGASPQWTRQNFEFQADLSKADSGTLHFDVMRVGPDGERSLGAAQVRVASLEPLVTCRQSLPLPQGGEVDIEVCYAPEIGEMEGAGEEPSASSAKTDPPPPADSKRPPDQPVAEAKPVERKKLSGKSPLFRPSDVDKLFKEVDADGDGVLGLQDMQAFFCDYCCYGKAEVASLFESHSKGSGVTPEVFKKEIRTALNPYLISRQSNRLIMRKPGAFGGMDCVDFNVQDCTDCTILICDRTAQACLEGNKNCTILIGPCDSSVSVRESENCTYWIACRQFRTRDCKNCTFYVYSASEPGIELSEGLSIAPFTAEYPGLTRQFEEARLNANVNFWSAIFDFNGKPDRANWSIRPLDDCETLVLAFDGAAAPDGPMPPLTQEVLLAKPRESSEGAGQSVANIPQTRPPPPPAPRRKHPGTKELLGRARRRNITESDTADRQGVLDLEDCFGNAAADAGAGNDDSIEEEIVILEDDDDTKGESSAEATAAVRTLRVGRELLNKGDDSDDDILPARRKGQAAAPGSERLMSRAKASGVTLEDSDDDDEPPLPKISPAAKKGLPSLFLKSAGNTVDDDSDDDVLAKKPAPLTGMAKLAASTLNRSMEDDDSDDDKLLKGSSPAKSSQQKPAASGKAGSDSDTSDSDGNDADKYMKWAKNAAKGSDDSD